MSALGGAPADAAIIDGAKPERIQDKPTRNRVWNAFAGEFFKKHGLRLNKDHVKLKLVKKTRFYFDLKKYPNQGEVTVRTKEGFPLGGLTFRGSVFLHKSDKAQDNVEVSRSPVVGEVVKRILVNQHNANILGLTAGINRLLDGVPTNERSNDLISTGVTGELTNLHAEGLKSIFP